MALTTVTTISADITASGLNIPVTSATGITVGMQARINNERIGAVMEIAGTTIRVRGRGFSATNAQAHKSSSAIIFGDPADFPSPVIGDNFPIPQWRDRAFYVADGAIALPVGNRDLDVIITKASAAAMTLAVPTSAQDGVRLTIIGLTDFAHVVTLATAAPDGTSGGSTIFTSPAFGGQSIMFYALKGVWIFMGGNGTNGGPWVLTG